MDNLTKHWGGLSLLDKEGPRLRLKKEQAMKEFCLAVKFLTNTFQPLWQSKNGFKVKNMGNHVVLFTFNNKNWVERILLSEP